MATEPVSLLRRERCENCKFWEQHTDSTHLGDGEYSEDDFASWGNCKRQNDPDLPVAFFSQDASDYSSWIVTRLTFSCVEWKPRP